MEEDATLVRAAGMKKQESGLKWDKTRQVKLGCNDIWRMEQIAIYTEISV